MSELVPLTAYALHSPIYKTLITVNLLEQSSQQCTSTAHSKQQATKQALHSDLGGTVVLTSSSASSGSSSSEGKPSARLGSPPPRSSQMRKGCFPASPSCAASACGYSSRLMNRVNGIVRELHGVELILGHTPARYLLGHSTMPAEGAFWRPSHAPSR